MNVSITRSERDPRGFCLTTQLLVAQPRSKVFEFFADAHEVETITPPWLYFSVRTPSPIEMQAGTLIDYRLRLHGLPIRWRSKISVWEPPCRFVDEQVRGPYAYWHHLHTFSELDGGTLVADTVHYAVPCSWIAHPLVRRDLRNIFQYRCDTMKQLFRPLRSVRNQSG